MYLGTFGTVVAAFAIKNLVAIPATSSPAKNPIIYQQKHKVVKVLHDHFDTPEPNQSVLIVDKAMLRKTVLGCMVICKGSTQDTQEFIQKIYGIHIATGTISHIIKEEAEKAKVFNQSIPLNTIEAGANDEIFQAGKPVLVGVDVYSTFIYLMQASESREGDDWALVLMEKIDQGLNLKLSVNDDGTGLKKGVKYISGHQEALLLFVLSANEAMRQLADEQGIDIRAFELMWEQIQYPTSSSKGWIFVNIFNASGILRQIISLVGVCPFLKCQVKMHVFETRHINFDFK